MALAVASQQGASGGQQQQQPSATEPSLSAYDISNSNSYHHHHHHHHHQQQQQLPPPQQPPQQPHPHQEHHPVSTAGPQSLAQFHLNSSSSHGSNSNTHHHHGAAPPSPTTTGSGLPPLQPLPHHRQQAPPLHQHMHHLYPESQHPLPYTHHHSASNSSGHHSSHPHHLQAPSPSPSPLLQNVGLPHQHPHQQQHHPYAHPNSHHPAPGQNPPTPTATLPSTINGGSNSHTPIRTHGSTASTPNSSNRLSINYLMGGDGNSSGTATAPGSPNQETDSPFLHHHPDSHYGQQQQAQHAAPSLSYQQPQSQQGPSLQQQHQHQHQQQQQQQVPMHHQQQQPAPQLPSFQHFNGVAHQYTGSPLQQHPSQQQPGDQHHNPHHHPLPPSQPHYPLSQQQNHMPFNMPTSGTHIKSEYMNQGPGGPMVLHDMDPSATIHAYPSDYPLSQYSAQQHPSAQMQYPMPPHQQPPQLDMYPYQQQQQPYGMHGGYRPYDHASPLMRSHQAQYPHHPPPHHAAEQPAPPPPHQTSDQPSQPHQQQPHQQQPPPPPPAAPNAEPFQHHHPGMMPIAPSTGGHSPLPDGILRYDPHAFKRGLMHHFFDTKEPAIEFVKEEALKYGFSVLVRTSKPDYVVVICNCGRRLKRLKGERKRNRRFKTAMTGCEWRVVLFRSGNKKWEFRATPKMDHNHGLPVIDGDPI
ncbi:hypothetical protein DFJ77DRAFT_514126 [Powellomyces hirtus]|nr:hypothetical protein DFJ77DRAFT_514126 [Powellomyces hirtus]